MNLYSRSIVLFGLLMVSCSSAQNSSSIDRDDEFESTNSSVPTSEWDIDKALDALTEIQANGDGKQMLYLTFPNIPHSECEGAESTYEISREEFHDALIDVMSQNNHKFTKNERDSLATIASKPLDQYTLNACGATSKSVELTKGAIPPRQGTWIVSAIFGVSDLLINW